MSGGLVEAFAGRASEDDVATRWEFFEGSDDGFRAQDHAWATASGSVIDLAMFAQAVLAEVMDVEIERALLLSSAHHAEAHGDADEVREKGDDIDAHEKGGDWFKMEGDANGVRG